jgi:exodeoxyribonuclease-3
VKIATWNVNGVRLAKRSSGVHRKGTARRAVPAGDQASIDQLPMWLCEIEGYWCYWHGGKGYSGLRCTSEGQRSERPANHPEFDYEHRIVTARLPGFTVASIYVPNGGKDFAAKMQFRVTRRLRRVMRQAASTWYSVET